MTVIAPWVFYGSLVFGFGFGVLACFFIGRLGVVQFLYWLPRPTIQSRQRDEGLERELIGAPSPLSMVLMLTPIGWLVGAWSLLVAIYRSTLGEALAYTSAAFGAFLGRLWLTLGVPCFVLDYSLSRDGAAFEPLWFAAIGDTTPILIGGGAYITAYFLGALVGSPQRKFNRARLAYETVVVDKGYWFDRIGSPGAYSDPTSQRLLRRAEAGLTRLHELLRVRPTTIETQDQIMNLRYQQALLYCTQGRFDEAAAAVLEAQQLNFDLGRRLAQAAGEREILAFIRSGGHAADRELESQLLFLDGEIDLACAHPSEALPKFQASLVIDLQRSDRDGVKRGQSRIALAELQASARL